MLEKFFLWKKNIYIVQEYKNKAEPVFKSSYDVFLKANKQSAGIDSYDLVVGLIINDK